MRGIFLLSLIVCIVSAGSAQSKVKSTKPKTTPIDLTKFSLIEGGSFMMGNNTGVEPHERPEHNVSISSFYLAKTELTWDDYEKFCDSTKHYKPDDMKWGKGTRPAVIVSWYDAVEYCNWLSKQQKLQPCYVIKDKEVTWLDTANGYRLPTEAEWEYAARGGSKSKKTLYAGADKIDDVAWYEKNSDNKTQPTAQKTANELGLYDMNGNVWEWVWDVYDGEYYRKSPAENPKGPGAGVYRVFRGGAWYNKVPYVTVSTRQYHSPEYRQNSVGFRIARNK